MTMKDMKRRTSSHSQAIISVVMAAVGKLLLSFNCHVISLHDNMFCAKDLDIQSWT